MDLVETFATHPDKMSTVEIAAMTGKQHGHVMRDVEEQLGQLEGGVSRFGHTYQNEQNRQTYRCYLLPKRRLCVPGAGTVA